MKFRAALLLATFLGVGLAAFAPAPKHGSGLPAPGPGEPTLDEVRRATDRFRDVSVALAEGYP
jgi:hypothetical protein